MVFGAAISGIQAAQVDLSVTGNNIANAGTIGFKSSRAEFVDVYASNSSGNAIGQGTRLSRVLQKFDSSQVKFTQNSLDLAIDGKGFFALSDQGSRVYSRAGAFIADKEGYIINSSQQRLVGLQADSSGNITPIEGDLRINTSNIAPQATSLAVLNLNLNSDDTISIPPSIAWAGGATPSTDTYNDSSSMTIYDSLGNSHVLSMYFIKADATAAVGAPNAASPAGTQNQWYVAFQIDNQDVPALGGATNSANLYRMNFDSSGGFAGTFDTGGAPLAGGLIPLTQALSNGASALSFNMDFSNSTQFGSPFATQPPIQDGYTTGRLDGISIDVEGILFGRYSNGEVKALGQVILANFNSPENLQKLGNTSWAETASSGQPLVGRPGTSSLGNIQSGALEESNVDISSELVNLISAQRNFQANAQTIRTGDAVTQAIINIR